MELCGLQMPVRGKELQFLGNRYGFGGLNRWINQLNSKRLPCRQIAQVCLVANKKSVFSYADPVLGIGAASISSSSSKKQNISISAEKLDEWMRDSVSEIVKNIGEAPFLVYVYSNPKKSVTTTTRLQREKAKADSWPSIRRGWEEGTPIPDGIILVDQLKSLQGDEHKGIGMGQPHSTTTLWGLLIQGRGADSPACYILKTCRVCSSIGFCTHFCLVRASCSGEIADWQLNDCWIL